MKKLLKHLTVMAAIVGFASSIYAVPTLTLFDGTTTIVVADESGLDTSSGILGVVTFHGSIGGWTLTIDTGSTKPALGTASVPHMDLSFNAQSAATMVSKFLRLTFTDDGFTYSGTLHDDWGGTSFGTVVNKVNVDGSTIIAQGPLGPGAFSSSASGSVGLASSDTLSLIIEITHAGSRSKQITTGNKDVYGDGVPDAGTTLALLGLGLTGLGVFGRGRKQSLPN